MTATPEIPETQMDAVLAAPVGDAAAMRGAIGRLHALLPRAADPRDGGEMLALLRVLYAVGRRDLPLGRVFEGHVDAMQIVARYGPAGLADELIARGAVLGVWNADLPGEPLVLADGRLSGAKSFASGAGILTHALVTPDTGEGRRLLLVDLDEVSPAIDRDWWHVVGMQRSETHRVRWQDADAAAAVAIGAPGDYVREPWFSGGALRFVAVHAGGVAALFDHVRAHLLATDRAGDPHQAGRLAALFGLADTAALAVRAAGEAWFADEGARLPRVAAARVRVAEAAGQAIVIAQEAVGVQGLFAGHPLAAALTDLMVYLRQPMPDAQRMRVGQAAADGLLVPGL